MNFWLHAGIIDVVILVFHDLLLKIIVSVYDLAPLGRLLLYTKTQLFDVSLYIHSLPSFPGKTFLPPFTRFYHR